MDDKSLWTAAGILGGALGTWLSARVYSRQNDRAGWLGYQERSLKAAVERADAAEKRVRDEENRHADTRARLFHLETKSAQYAAMVIMLREAVHHLQDRLGIEHTQFPEIPPGGD